MGIGLGWEWDGNGMGMGWEWDGNGMGMGWEWYGNGMGMGKGLKFLMMGLNGNELSFQMNKILFYLQILSFSWLLIKSNQSTFSSERLDFVSQCK